MAAKKSAEYYAVVDGLRAMAVIAVLLYHQDVAWLPGGYLGVEVFFVISGFIITSQLSRHWDIAGMIDYPAFLSHRCFRLLPGMLAMILVSWIAVSIAWTEELHQLRSDTPASFLFLQNWQLIINDLAYFDAMGRPRIFQHLWSLGVEFQFYLLWPLVCLGMFRLPLVWQPPMMMLLVIASYTWMAVSAGGLESGDSSRIYLGTDTRVGAIILGAALARALRAYPRLGRIIGLPGVSPMGFGTLLTLHYVLEESMPVLYQGGFAFVAVLSAIVIGGTLVNPAGTIGRFLGSSPMTAIGRRAYSLYLWHWPVFCLSQPYVDVPIESLTLFFVRLVATLILSELSYRIVEMPFRGGKVLIALREIWADSHLRPVLLVTAGLYGCLACVLGIAVLNPGTMDNVARSASQFVSPDVEAAETLGDFSHGAVVADHLVDGSYRIPVTAENVYDIPAGLEVAVESCPPIPDPGLQVAGENPRSEKENAPAAEKLHKASLMELSAAAEFPTTDVSKTPVTDEPPPMAMPVADEVTSAEIPEAPAFDRALETAVQEKRGGTETPTNRTTEGKPRRPQKFTGCLAPTPGISARSPVAVEQGKHYVSRMSPSDEKKRTVYAVGDSVILGAFYQLRKRVGNIDIDAQVGRHLVSAIPLFQRRLNKGVLSDTVLIHLGNNGAFSQQDIDRLLKLLEDVPRVLFINLKLPRSYEGKNNQRIMQAIDGDRIRVLDWRTLSLNSDKVFAGDGIHLTAKGARLYTEMIAEVLCPESI